MSEWRKRETLIPLLYAALVFLIYFPLIGANFLHFDDALNITQNPFFSQSFSKFWIVPYYGMYIPVTYSVWYLMWHITHHPFAFHLFNLLLHTANGYLIYLILKRSGVERSLSILAGIIFLIHPLQVEPVAWVSGARDLLAAFFALSSILLWLADGEIAAVAVCSLALLSKPVVAFVPLLFWLSRPKSLWPLVSLLIGGTLLWITQKFQSDVPNHLLLFDRFKIALDTFAFAFSKIAWPVHLSADYGRRPDVVLNQKVWVWGTVLFFLMLSGAIALRRRLRQVSWLGLGLSVVTFLPICGFITGAYSEFTVFSDRYCYLPIAGLVILIFSVLPPVRWSTYVSIILSLGIAGLASAQVPYWKSDDALFTRAHDLNHDSIHALCEIAMKIQTSQPKNAEAMYNHIHEIDPIGSCWVEGLSLIYLTQGRYQDALDVDRSFMANPEARAHISGTAHYADILLYEGVALEHLSKLQDAHLATCSAIRIGWMNRDAEDVFISALNELETRMKEKKMTFTPCLPKGLSK